MVRSYKLEKMCVCILREPWRGVLLASLSAECSFLSCGIPLCGSWWPSWWPSAIFLRCRVRGHFLQWYRQNGTGVFPSHGLVKGQFLVLSSCRKISWHRRTPRYPVNVKRETKAYLVGRRRSVFPESNGRSKLEYAGPIERWSMEFVHDTLADGGRVGS